tara:strand:- start:3229 stop:4950 length:1722 start_codon:yes stop_codon:yes gene_type:complete
MNDQLYQRVTISKFDAKKLHFDRHLDRFVNRRFLAESPSQLGAAEAWMQQPVPGVAKLLQIKMLDDGLEGHFESLPGFALDQWIWLHGPLPIPDWLCVAKQMVALAREMRKRPEVRVDWLPSDFQLWRESDGQLRIALNAVSIVGEQVSPRKEKQVVENLALTWHFLLTSEIDHPFYGLTGSDFENLTALQDFAPLVKCFETLFAERPEERADELPKVLQLLEAISDALPHFPNDANHADQLHDPLAQEPESGLALSRWDIPENFTLSANETGGARGTIPAVHDISQREVMLHLVPEPAARRVADDWIATKRAVDNHVISPVLSIHQKGLNGGIVIERTLSKSISLAELIEAGGVDIGTLRNLLFKLDASIREAEGDGVSRVSLHAHDVLLVPRGQPTLAAEHWPAWASDPEAFSVRLRPVATSGGNFTAPAGHGLTLADRLIAQLELPVDERGFLELAIRLLQPRLFFEPEIAAIFRRASHRRINRSVARKALLRELAEHGQPDNVIPFPRPSMVTMLAGRLAASFLLMALVFGFGNLLIPDSVENRASVENRQLAWSEELDPGLDPETPLP